MHLLTALSLKNRALIALVTIVAAVFGLLGVGSLKQELMPSVQFPAIAVVTTYPGASPEVVNKEVSGPIETALRGVPQLESSTATSSTGASMVLAQFTYGVDIAATEQKVERAVSRINQMLPEAADTQVMSGSIDDFPVIQIAVTPAEGDTPEATAKLVERIALPELADIDGVRDAQLSGARPDRITIVPNAEALAAQGLTPQVIADTLQQSGVLVAAGSITEGDQTLSVQAGSSVTSAEDIAALPVAISAAQLAAQQQAAAEQQVPARPGVTPDVEEPVALTPLTIGELATVQLEPGPVQSISRVDGAPALTIGVTKMSAANTVDVSHAVQEKLTKLQDQLSGAKLSIIFDQAPYVEQSIETLTTEGLLGLLFAVLVILVFLMSVRATLVTAISIPTSVLLTFIGLNFADYTLNMLTLGALTISIGRVVDDSIVVIENIKRHLVSDTDRSATIIRAVREVAGAITASTITTVAVFLPMAFVAGMVGELFRPFAFTVTIALAASLLVSLTIVPVLAYWFLKPERSGRRATTVSQKPDQPTRLQRWYRPVIDWTLRRPAVTLLVSALVFGGTVALGMSPLLKTNFMGADEQNSVGLVQTLAPGTSLDAQLAQVERVEGALADVPAVETVQVTVGNGGGGMAAIFGGGGDGAVNYSLTTDPDANQEQAQDAIRAAVDSLEYAGEFSLGQSGGGVTTSSAIEVNVTAPDQATLETASTAVLDALSEQKELKQVESDLGLSRPYLSITVDRAAAAAAGLTEAGVAGQVAQQMQPREIGQITLDADTTSVYLSDGVEPTDQASVAALPIQTAVGPQTLDTLATIAVADGPVTIRTQDNARMVTVSALSQGDDLSAASAAVTAALDTVELPAGASASIGGVMTQQSEAFEQLGIALLAAILIVYVVMVATFRSLLQPLLLLISVPFAATGAIVLLVLTGIPLGVASLIGVLMLIGIVVTNAIVLIDLVNQYREKGESLKHAVTHGALQRLRPIVMTALATILALTPMALGITGKGGFISQPLAVVVIGGLLTSTIMTLVVLPTLYYAVERRREGRADRRATRKPKRGGDDAGLVLAGSGLVGGGATAGGAVGVAPWETGGPLRTDSSVPALPAQSDPRDTFELPTPASAAGAEAHAAHGLNPAQEPALDHSLGAEPEWEFDRDQAPNTDPDPYADQVSYADQDPYAAQDSYAGVSSGQDAGDAGDAQEPGPGQESSSEFDREISAALDPEHGVGTAQEPVLAPELAAKLFGEPDAASESEALSAHERGSAPDDGTEGAAEPAALVLPEPPAAAAPEVPASAQGEAAEGERAEAERAEVARAEAERAEVARAAAAAEAEILAAEAAADAAAADAAAADAAAAEAEASAAAADAAAAQAAAEAEAARHQSIREALMRAGLAAPETSGAAAAELAEPERPVTREMGPDTRQMSISLSELGFTGDDNPLDPSATPHSEVDVAAHADDSAQDDDAALGAAPSHGRAPAADAIPTEQSQAPASELEPAPESPAEPAPDFTAESAPESAQGPASATIPLFLPPQTEDAALRSEHGAEQSAAHATGPDSALEPESTKSREAALETESTVGGQQDADAEPVAPAPPITGELNWEQLLWQATQEVDEEDSDAPSDAAGEADADHTHTGDDTHDVDPHTDER
ncbi:efflux RND transporter permease subunit [Leucobacter luti]|nr:efflux RND transporter permease subunit [Leucobacter luti]